MGFFVCVCGVELDRSDSKIKINRLDNPKTTVKIKTLRACATNSLTTRHKPMCVLLIG